MRSALLETGEGVARSEASLSDPNGSTVLVDDDNASIALLFVEYHSGSHVFLNGGGSRGYEWPASTAPALQLRADLLECVSAVCSSALKDNAEPMKYASGIKEYLCFYARCNSGRHHPMSPFEFAFTQRPQTCFFEQLGSVSKGAVSN